MPTTPPLLASPPGHRWREPGGLEPGQIVRVRSRQYLVEDLTPPKQHGDATLVRLSCLEDDALGDPLEVLWECEVDARVLGKSSSEAVAERGVDRPELLSAYLHTLRWGCVTSTNQRLFQAPYRAGIQVKDYQLAPLRKTKTINKELGSLTPVVVKRMAQVLDHGIAHGDVERLAGELEALGDGKAGLGAKATTDQVIAEELEPVRRRRKALEQEIAELREMLAEARKWLALDHRHFSDALSVGLELLGAEALRPVDAEQAIRGWEDRHVPTAVRFDSHCARLAHGSIRRRHRGWVGEEARHAGMLNGSTSWTLGRAARETSIPIRSALVRGAKQAWLNGAEEYERYRLCAGPGFAALARMAVLLLTLPCYRGTPWWWSPIQAQLKRSRP